MEIGHRRSRWGLALAISCAALGAAALPASALATPAPVALTQDINLGNGTSNPSNLTDGAGELYFAATDPAASGIELYKSDGTPGGTELVKDISPGSGSSNPDWLAYSGGKLYFSAFEATNGTEPWTSDGSTGGTNLLTNVNVTTTAASSTPALFHAIGGYVYFRADDGLHGVEPFRTDGTPGGTEMVADINQTLPATTSHSYPGEFTGAGGNVYFDASAGAEYKVWKTDGTTTAPVVDASGYPSSPSGLTNFNGTIFFTARDTIGMHSDELWRTDGTQAGTKMVKDIYTGAANAGAPEELTVAGNTLYFSADDGSHGRELWKSDGTEAGTKLVRDVDFGSEASNPGYLTAVGNELYFAATDGSANHGRELWKSDGTSAGTELVKDINPTGDSGPHELKAMNGRLYFAADDGTHGVELWQSDGTGPGTTLVADVNPSGSAAIDHIAKSGGRIFFTADDGTHGVELWAGQPVADPAPGALALASTLVGRTSAAKTVQLHNSGLGPIHVASASLTGAGASSFKITGNTCSGATVGAGLNCAVTIAFAPHTAGAKAATLHFTDDDADGEQTVSVSGTGLPDNTPPTATITAGPSGATGDSTPTFAFKSSEAGSTFKCRIDAGAFGSCSSPHTLAALADGSHTFAVEAIDPADNVSSPASRTFKVDTKAPQTTLDSVPKTIKAKKKAKVKFAFSSSEMGSSFACILDGSDAFRCSSPYTAKLGKGKHSFEVAATDAAGNTDKSPATAKLKVKGKKKRKHHRAHRTATL